MQPSVGQIVHLLTTGSHDCQAAIVTRVHDDGETVALAVFEPPGTATAVPEEAKVVAFGEVPYGPEPSAAPSWHWPENVDG
jgi:hypothetical protein